ncbi:MAG TPA: hypothetical protein VMJ10_12475 [Kofleriaceae bacterium]|nr:hypothetical protein [Kofleriaceae bacterium]
MRGLWICLACGIAACGGGADKCKVGETSCGGTCVDLLSSNSDCGACGSACSAAQVCGNGTCADNCPVNQTNCDGTCADLSSDANNCSACGSACATGDTCAFGACQPPCDATMLTSAIEDPWGAKWDGLERTAAALDAAEADCKAFGARLPTATELYRVSATQSGAVGQSFNTNYLWSEDPDDDLNQSVLRLSDGGTTTQPATTATPYRCVCPAPTPRTFTGANCDGMPSVGCFAFGPYNIDQQDRPALRSSAAAWECANAHGHVVDAPMLAEAIRAGLPGSGAYVRTSDMAEYPNVEQFAWTGTATSWEPASGIQMIDLRTPSTFRCYGPSGGVSPNPNTIANEFVPATSSYVGETTDRASAAWVAAQDACFAAGGHLPRAGELAELIQQGLPGGSSQYLWTSDEVGYINPPSQFLSEILVWTDLDVRFSFAYTAAAEQSATWDYKTDSHPFRCIYYPIDTTYQAPTNCYAGCFAVTLPGNPAATMWFDSQDRVASTLGAAFGDCQASGAVLASERDLTEAIRNSLPNGTGAMASPWIWTSDFAQNNITVVQWSNVETSFADQYPANMTWVGVATTSVFRYRCMWTNEVR